MGAIADAIVSYAQPLFDETDGSIEEMEKALAVGQFCWNLALLPDDRQDEALSEMRQKLGMDDDDFDAFRQSIAVPMIRRHRKMFPQLHRPRSTGLWQDGSSPGSPSLRELPGTAAAAEKYPGTDRYAPCPCNSGRKYKFCCGAKGR